MCSLLVAVCVIQFPNQGSNLGSLHWEHGVLATGPPGKSLLCFQDKRRDRLHRIHYQKKKNLKNFLSNYKNNTYLCRNLQSTEKLKVIINCNFTTSRTFFFGHFSMYLPGFLVICIYTYMYIPCFYHICSVCFILFLKLFILFCLSALDLRCFMQAFSSCGRQGLLLVVVQGFLVAVAFLFVEPQVPGLMVFSSCSTWAQQLWLTGSGAWAQAQLLHTMWNLPRPGITPVSPDLADRFLSTAPPGNSCILFLNNIILYILFHNRPFSLNIYPEFLSC